MLNSYKFTLMVCLVPFVSFIGGTIYASAFPELGLVFNVSSTLIKFSLTVYFVGLIVGTILSGPLSDLYGRLYILVFFLGIFSLSSIACGFSPSISWFLVARFFQGIGSAAGAIAIISFIADRFEGAEYKKFISYVLIMLGLSHGFAPMIGSFILGFFDWKGIFYFLALAGLGAIALTLSVGIEKKGNQRKITEMIREYMVFIKHPFFRHYCLVIGVLYGAFNSILVISPYIFRIHYGWSIIEFSWVGLALAFGDGMGAFLNETFVEKLGSRRIVFIGLLVSMAALILLFVFQLPVHSVWFLCMTTLFVIGGNLIAACLTTDAVKMHPLYTGIASSLIYFTKFIMCSLVLTLVLFLPNSLITINLFIFIAIVLSYFGYLKIRSIL